MKIAELSNYIYEDLEARITCVRWVEDTLEIFIVCDDPQEDRKRKFRIICTGVVEVDITLCAFGLMSMPESHPVLLDHIDDFGYLAFSSPPQIAEIVVSRLYATHYKLLGDWRPLSAYVNHFKKEGIAALLGGGMGMIAQGPHRVLCAYQEAISDLLITSLVRHERQKKSSIRLLLLDAEYVIAQSFESNEEEA